MTGTLCNFGLNVGGLDLVDWYWFMDILSYLLVSESDAYIIMG